MTGIDSIYILGHSYCTLHQRSIFLHSRTRSDHFCHFTH